MMTDLVHEHVFDDGAQRLVVLRPIIEDRPAIEPDHIRHLNRGTHRTKRQPDAMEQAEQVEFTLDLHPLDHLLAWEIVHPDDDIGGKFAKPPRKLTEDFAGQGFQFGQRGRLDRPPGERIGVKIGHNRHVVGTAE